LVICSYFGAFGLAPLWPYSSVSLNSTMSLESGMRQSLHVEMFFHSQQYKHRTLNYDV